MDVLTVSISAVISSIIVCVFYLPGIKVGLNTADEAYLHFGTVSLLEGKTPIRDYRAYDPGRYYWCALWMKVFGTTYTTQRLAMGLIMIAALSVYCSLIFMAGQSWTLATLAGLISFSWMRPYFKAIEILFSLVAVILSFCVILNPGLTVYFCSGFVVGFALFLGLNIALYSGASFLLALFLSLVVSPVEITLEAVTWMILGFVLGLFPLLVLGFRNPGYFSVYWDKKIRTVVKRGTSNLPLPLPWLWRKPIQFGGMTSARQVFFKTIFTCLAPGYVVSMVIGFGIFDEQAVNGGLIISASLVGIVYLHWIFSRADLLHLCQAIHPALLLMSVLLVTFLPWIWAVLSLAIIIALSIWAVVSQDSERFKYFRNKSAFVKYQSTTEGLVLHADQAKLFTALGRMIDGCSKPGDAAFFAATMPGFHRLFNRRPAHYDIFCVYPETVDNQLNIIRALNDQQTRISIIFEAFADKNQNFSNTHSMVWQYLESNFERVEHKELPHWAHVFKRELP